MTRVVLWSSNAGDIPANLAFTNNFSALVNPTVGNDISQGYSVGSVWINSVTDQAFICTDQTKGAALWVPITEGGTQGQVIAPAASTPTGVGGAALVAGGTGGATSGEGGIATLAGGAGSGGNANGGPAIVQGGAPNGSGTQGPVIERGSVILRSQGAAAALTVSAVLTAAQILGGLLTASQGAAGAAAYQLPLATALDTALPDVANNDSFDFSLINISTNAAEAASITTNTGWTLVGDMDIQANNAATTKSAGRFRARRTGAGAWTLYRIS